MVLKKTQTRAWSKRFWTIELSTLALCTATSTTTQVAGTNCLVETSSLYHCPITSSLNDESNVEIRLVADCLEECPGFRSTDADHGICFKRQLFNYHNTAAGDHANHYHHLWREILGALLWLALASFATAGGVSGGVIYVVFGVLVLAFAPKQASGLAQASNFGAGLGALILNLRNRYPKMNIRNVPGEAQPDGRCLHPQDDEELLDATEDGRRSQYTGMYYTRPLVNYDLALFLAPALMGGAILGVLIQVVVPNWLYLLIAAVAMTFTTYKTAHKYVNLHSEEIRRKIDRNGSKEIKIENLGDMDLITRSNSEDGPSSQGMNDKDVDINSCQPPVEEKSSLYQDDGNVTNPEDKSLSSRSNSATSPPNAGMGSDLEDLSLSSALERATMLRTNEADRSMLSDLATTVTDTESILRGRYLQEDMKQLPWNKIRALCLLWIGLTFLTIVGGGQGFGWSILDVSCGSLLYGMMLGFKCGWLFGFALFHGRRLLSHQQERVAVNYPFLPEDIMWDTVSLRNYGVLTFVAGVVAGLIGSGGGTLLGPILLVRGLHPRVTAATTATLIVLTSSSIAVVVVASDVIHWSYALFFFTLCFVGAIGGKSVIDGYVQRTGRPSILVLILTVLVALVTVGCVTIIFLDISSNNWCLDGFSDFCAAV